MAFFFQTVSWFCIFFVILLKFFLTFRQFLFSLKCVDLHFSQEGYPGAFFQLVILQSLTENRVLENSCIKPKNLRCFQSSNHLQSLSPFLRSKEINCQSCHLQSNLNSYKTSEKEYINFCRYSKQMQCPWRDLWISMSIFIEFINCQVISFSLNYCGFEGN